MRKILIITFAIICSLTFTYCTNKKDNKCCSKTDIDCNDQIKDSIPSVSKEFLLGRFDPKNDSNFTVVEDPYCDRPNMYINKETYSAYKAMYDSAKQEGIILTIVSATRNFNYQKSIWDRKWNKFTGTDSVKVKKIMRYSSMPGTSRHHWGSDMDLISVETYDWTHGKCLKAFNWLKKNAHKFGFFQPYTDDPNRGGYCEERWHWSYAPLSEGYLKAYEKYITEDDIYGFDGSEYAKKFGIIKTHVMGITPKEGY